MTINSFPSKYNSRNMTPFPLCLPAQTYGTTLFWAEEYWAFVKIQELKRQYPHLDFSGLIDPYFVQKVPNLVKTSFHGKILDTRRFNDISTFLWEDNRRVLNIATSHAPSRVIAKDYWNQFRDDFGIITFDAHLDLSNSQNIHGVWITKELAGITTVIGGWADTSHDFEDASNLFPFIKPSIKEIFSNHDFYTWLKGKKIYLSIDLDYYQFSQRDYLGYSNFWHRNKIIGHSMTIEQILAEHKEEDQIKPPTLLGKSLGYFPNLELFTQRKKKSLKNQTTKILNTLKKIKQLCSENSATLLCIDFVEYSPICDWHQLTINEFIKNYPRFQAIIYS